MYGKNSVDSREQNNWMSRRQIQKITEWIFLQKGMNMIWTRMLVLLDLNQRNLEQKQGKNYQRRTENTLKLNIGKKTETEDIQGKKIL